MKDTIIKDLWKNQSSIFNKVKGRLNPFWILLCYQTTVHVFFNTIFLQNITTVEKELHLYINKGMSVSNEVGDLLGFVIVWLYQDGIANVLPFKGVKAKKGYKIEYNRTVIDVFKVITVSRHVRNFISSRKGLYDVDSSKDFNYIVSGSKHVWFAKPDYDDVNSYAREHIVLRINSIEENKRKFSKQVIQEEAAQKLQHDVAGYLSYWQLLKIAQKNQLKNSPIMPKDVRMMLLNF